MSAWRVIYRKELVDTLRDRRTLATMLIVPMVAYPLTLLFTTETIAVHQREGETREVHVVVSQKLPSEAIDALEQAEQIRVETATIAASTSTASRDARDPLAAAAKALLAESDTDAVVIADARARDAIGASGTAEIAIYFDSTKTYADSAVRRIEKALGTWARSVRDERMRTRNLPPTAAVPISIERRSISSDEQVGSQIAALTLPALLLVFIALSSFYPAVDLTAGEKERKTLATLLTAPIRAIDIVLGKYLAVVTVGTLAGLLNVVVLALTLLRVVGAQAETKAAQFSVPVLPIIELIPLVTLVSLPIGALMLLVAALARSFRDASYLLTPVLLIAIAPATIASLPGFELTPVVAAIPLANAALLMKAVLMGKATIDLALIAIVSSLAFTALLLFFCARIFSDERVLFSTSGRRAEASSLFSRPPPPSLSTALVFASAIFIGNYYGGFLTDGWAAVEGIAFTQAFAHIAPALLLAWWMRDTIAPAQLLRLRAPDARAMIAAIAIGSGAWLGISLPSGWLTSYLIPGQSEAARAFAKALGLESLDLLTAIISFALIPAIAEEVAFRGVLLGLFERTLRPRSALIAQAVLFGLMHGSIFRFLPTALLGLLLGVLAVRTRSIWPGISAHAMTNGILIAIEETAPESISGTLERPTLIALFGLLLVGLGLWTLRWPGKLTAEERNS